MVQQGLETILLCPCISQCAIHWHFGQLQQIRQTWELSFLSESWKHSISVLDRWQAASSSLQKLAFWWGYL